MSEFARKFNREAERVAFDKEHRKRIKFNISRYDVAVEKGKNQYRDLELAKKRAAFQKQRILKDLENQLGKFETKFTESGGKVLWAANAKEAVDHIMGIIRKHGAKKVVKSKSMTTEEIEINEAMEKSNVETVETDLGEYIVQIAGEKPYHIVTPAMHKSKEDIADLFHKKFDTPAESTPEEITAFVRKLLREKFMDADIGITGCNFLLADTGSICLTENEGNAMLSFSFPKVHIAVAGIEKLIPSMDDLDLFWPLLASHGTGQNITVYNSIVSGPKQAGESDGPEEMYVILLDNGRTKLLAEEKQRIALSCIRCGACLNSCPIYRNVGGYTYAATYSGPIGSVITPFMSGMRNYKHLSFASSLCGKCTEVCPVNIPLHELLLLNRNHAVKKGNYRTSEKISMLAFKKALSSRKMMDIVGGNTKNFILKATFRKNWGVRRELPKLSSKSFSERWKEENGE